MEKEAQSSNQWFAGSVAGAGGVGRVPVVVLGGFEQPRQHRAGVIRGTSLCVLVWWSLSSLLKQL